MTDELQKKPRHPGGRPRLAEPRATTLTTRVTSGRYDDIYRAAKRERVTLSTYVKRALDRSLGKH